MSRDIGDTRVTQSLETSAIGRGLAAAVGESAAGEERELDLGERIDLLGAPLQLPGGLRQ